ncbi:MAG TPA: hypothetical protein VHU22_19765 [Xanthobacteraceae bacterium]|jgi:hypothetical protein|nr:hypothetical protein [Xanthobacteraceae bacterium]
MLDLAQAVREQIVNETPPRKTAAAPNTFTFLRKLRSYSLWSMGTAAAVALAILAGRSEVGAERFAAIFHPSRPQPSAAKFDAENAARQLSEAVRVLASNDAQTRARVVAIEHDLDDVTGSIRQVAAASEAKRADDGPTVSAIASLTASSAAPINPPPPPPSFSQSEPATPSAPPPTQYGVDIGSGLSLQALRARWQTLRTTHAALLEGMQPIVTVRETVHGKIELRLVVGPLPQPGAASQLCQALTMFGMFCQTTVYDGQHLAQK